VLVNTASTAVNAPVIVAGGGSLSAAVWQIHQTGSALPAAPAHVATLSTGNGQFTVNLPAQSVTTLIVTAN
jgi:O-glycosyl hydrolase